MDWSQIYGLNPNLTVKMSSREFSTLQCYTQSYIYLLTSCKTNSMHTISRKTTGLTYRNNNIQPKDLTSVLALPTGTNGMTHQCEDQVLRLQWLAWYAPTTKQWVAVGRENSDILRLELCSTAGRNVTALVSVADSLQEIV